MYGSLEEFPLRQVNFVKTRTSVLKAVTNLLKTKTFEEITVDEICHITQISRGTFFNYFPNKEYVFYYYLKVFTIKISQRIKHWDKEMSFKQKLEQIYIWFDEENQYPRFIEAYIKYLLDESSKQDNIKLTVAEFVYFFTDIDSEKEYAYYNKLTMEDIIRELCQEAIAKGEIEASGDIETSVKIYLSMLLVPFISNKVSKVSTPSLDIFNEVMDRVAYK